MKVDETKEYISSIVDTYEICHDAKHTSVAVSIGAEDAKALNMAIASLEVWEKVKAEIDEQYDRVHPYNISCAEGLEMALEIIDKHLKEVTE